MITEVIKKLLESKTKTDSTTGCWLYTGLLDDHGYGTIKIERINYKVHRLSLWIFKKFDLHSEELALHSVRCPNRNCWNPEHLRAGDQSDNMYDAKFTGTFANQNTNKTHCKNGHKFTKNNTYIRPNGNRTCIECNKLNQRKSVLRRKQKAA